MGLLLHVLKSAEENEVGILTSKRLEVDDSIYEKKDISMVLVKRTYRNVNVML